MRMDDETLKRILQEGMDYEADLIMDEVNSDPNIQNAVAPEAIYENMWKEIQGYKDADAKEQEKKAQEEQELIRLGKLYKKKRARNKYIILIAAVVCALGIGTISFGDGKKVFTEIKRVLGDREQTVVNSGDEDRHIDRGMLSEEDAYEEINEKFGFYPVKLIYLPEGMEFADVIIEEDSQNVRLYYEDNNARSVSFSVITNHRTGSIGIDVDDKLVHEYTKNIDKVELIIQEYLIEENNTNRWMVNFDYENAQYSIILTGLQKEETEKILENLFFS